MVCPFCRNKELSVYNSRPSSRTNQIWRRRRCQNCGNTFTTHETIDYSNFRVSKRNGRSESFSRAKLYLSLAQATAHRRKGDDAFALADTIEAKLLRKKHPSNKFLSSDIADVCLETLKRFDRRAYLKYLAHQSGDAE